ncbi:MAG: tripartite tricarboxylate transporter substrate binding protein [Hyphomicrobiales bacterium]
MKITALSRRAALTAASAALLAGPQAGAQAFPNRPIRFIVPNPPGGGSDLLGRGLANYLANAWSATIVPENRSGAAGAIGADIVAKAPPDGYTMFIGNIGPNAINKALVANLAYDPSRDFTPISQFIAFPNVLIVHPSVKAESVKDLIDLAKAKPGGLSYASSGPGSSLHLSGELFQVMASVKLTHVPYRGAAPAIADLLAGVVDMIFENITNALPHIRANKVRALAVTTLARSPELPTVPTLSESGLPGYDVSSWFGLFGPADLPSDLVERYYAGVKGYLAQPGTAKQLGEMGANIVGSSPKEFAVFVRSEIAKWTKLVEQAGIPKQQ